VKRTDLIRHLRRSGCELLREGSNHSLYTNRAAGTVSAVPRHREINDTLSRKTCRDLDIVEP